MDANGLQLQYDHGVHLLGTILWFDPTRKRELCAISSARVPATERQHKVVWGDRTARLVCHVNPKRARGLVCPNDRPFSLGSVTVQLFPSGYMAGASQFEVVSSQGERLIYSGPFSLKPNRTAEPIEIRKANTVVVDATYGHPQYAFPNREHVYLEIVEWIHGCQRDGVVPVLLAANPGKAQDLIHLLGQNNFNLRVHRGIHAFNKAYLDVGISLPQCKQFRGSPSPHDVVIWPSHLRKSSAIRNLRKTRVAATTGMGNLDGTAKRLHVDHVFTWSARADYADILSYIQQTRAKRVFTVGRHATDLANSLKTQLKLDARALLPTPQLSLQLGE